MAAIETAEADTTVIKGRYLYAIVDGDRGRYDFTGMETSPVYAMGDGEVAAIVSEINTQKLRPERRRLAAHHQVLKHLMADQTVLPMVFGLIADSPDAVRRILRLNRDSFLEQFHRVRGKVEMGVRVTWDVPNIFEYMLTLHPDLKVFRDHLFRGVRDPSYDERIELGRHFDQTMSKEREDHTEAITQALSSQCAEIVVNKPRQEQDITNLACLVDQDRLREFEAGLIEVAKQYDNHYAFDFNGPWPPHNFVEIDLRL